MNHMPSRVKMAYAACSEFAKKNIYRSDGVLEVELAGYRIIGHLLEVFTHAVQNPGHTYSRLLLDRIPKQYVTDAPHYTCAFNQFLIIFQG